MTAGSTTLFDQLCDQLREQPDHTGEVWIDCPWCGHGKKHFSFSERGYKCFSCNEKGKSLRRLAEQLQIADRPAPRVTRRQEPQRPRQWQQRPEWYLDRYCAALDRVQAWQAYKPLSLESIARWRLGVGVLPSSRCQHRRLILPVFEAGRVVAFHGRAWRPDDTDAKWLSAGGSSKQALFNADCIMPNSTVIICENFVDCILAMQMEPGIVAVAGGGAAWQPHWTEQIVCKRPARVLVWLDNDGVGCPNEETYRAFVAEWKQKHPGNRVPEPRGPQIANDLLRAGVSATVYQWKNGTPAKMDIGTALTNASAQ